MKNKRTGASRPERGNDRDNGRGKDRGNERSGRRPQRRSSAGPRGSDRYERRDRLQRAQPEADNEQQSDQALQPETEFIYGKHAALSFINDGAADKVNKIFLQKGLHGELADQAREFASQHRLVLQEVPKTRLDELTDQGNHQGILITVAPYDYVPVSTILAQAAAKNEAPLLIILDNLNDPHNLGSILRTADAIGAHGVIIPKRRSVGVTAVVAKTATGALEHVPVARVTNLVATIKELKDQGIWVFGTAMAGEDYRQWNSRGPMALVIGNEGKGISPLVAKTVDGLVTIPMIGHVQSLNASVATSVLLYHVFDQRHPLVTKD